MTSSSPEGAAPPERSEVASTGLAWTGRSRNHSCTSSSSVAFSLIRHLREKPWSRESPWLLGHLADRSWVFASGRNPIFGPASSGRDGSDQGERSEVHDLDGFVNRTLGGTHHTRLAKWTGVVAGALVASYTLVEAPLSGMSMNPARTVGSAVLANVWTALWLYFVAPLMGMLGAAELHRRPTGAVHCAKLQHDDRAGARCHFERCGEAR